MHDTTDQVHWHEPKAGENAGFGKFLRKPMPYDSFMESEGIPIYRGIGVRRVQDLPMAPWKRLGGRGSYIQLYGTEGLWGMYVVEVPGAGALNIERHLYEKVCWSWKAAARPKSGRKARRGGTRSNGRRARCSRSRSTRTTASSTRRARRRSCCAARRRRT